MYTLYRIKANDLDSHFLKGLKETFKDKDIEIAVCDIGQIAEDETSYLMKSPANRDQLLRAIENVSQEHNLVTVQLDK